MFIATHHVLTIRRACCICAIAAGATVSCSSQPVRAGEKGAGVSPATTGSNHPSTDEDDDEGYPIFSAGQGGGAGGAGGATSAADAASCLRLLSLGAVASGGVVPGEGGLDAVVDWLNRTSTISAEHIVGPTSLTPQLLSDVDVLLLQDLSAWTPSAGDEYQLKSFVSEGGSVIALSGYGSSDAGVRVTNQLLSFSGLKFNVAELDTATALGVCGYCLGSSKQVTGFDTQHPIGRDVTAIGAFLGRSIQGQGLTVVSEYGLQLGVAQSVEDGRVFLYHDDWITYVPQWTGETPGYCENNPSCSADSPSTSYQIAQFWYNLLSWAAPQAACISIDDDSIIP